MKRLRLHWICHHPPNLPSHYGKGMAQPKVHDRQVVLPWNLGHDFAQNPCLGDAGMGRPHADRYGITMALGEPVPVL